MDTFSFFFIIYSITDTLIDFLIDWGATIVYGDLSKPVRVEAFSQCGNL